MSALQESTPAPTSDKDETPATTSDEEEQETMGPRGSTMSTRSKFHCEDHDAVQPFMLKELRTQVFDTYAICAALLTTLSSSRFFFDNRDPTEFLSGKGLGTTCHMSWLLQHIHILLASICTAAGMEAMMVFVLSAMYSRSALALAQVGGNVFEFFLKQTGNQRKRAFGFLLTSGILSSLNLVVMCMAMPTFVLNTQVPAIVLDVCSVVSAVIVMAIVGVTVSEILVIMNAAKIIFTHPDKIDEVAEQMAPLLEEGKKDVNERRESVRGS